MYIVFIFLLLIKTLKSIEELLIPFPAVGQIQVLPNKNLSIYRRYQYSSMDLYIVSPPFGILDGCLYIVSATKVNTQFKIFIDIIHVLFVIMHSDILK